MGSDLYAITAVATSTTDVTLAIACVHPDSQYLPADKSFALMLLHEGAKDSAPLAREIGFEDTLDKTWMSKFAAGFISKVAVTNIKRKPPAAALADGSHAYWKSSPWMSGEYKITVTDPAWISHVKPRATWDSRAFALVSKYERCAPITPAAAKATKGKVAPAPAGSIPPGFMPVPGNLWHVGHRLKPAPRTVLVPAHGEGAYRVVGEIKKPLDAKKLAPFANRAVRLSYYGHSRDGVLILASRHFVLGTITTGSWGTSGNTFDAIDKIGALELKPNARVGETLGYARVFQATPAYATKATVAGAVVTFEIELSPDGRAPSIKSAADALRVVMTPGLDSADRLDNGRTKPVKLAKALIDERDGDDNAGDAYVQCANGFVKSYKFTLPKKPRLPKQLDAAKAQALFEGPRSIAILKVTMTDAVWLEHLRKFKAFPIESRPLAKARPWKGAQRRA